MFQSEKHEPRPSPVRTVETSRFWDASNRGELLFGHCDACGERHFYPRSRCPWCFSERVEWKRSSGRGVIYAYSAVSNGDRPYVAAYISLEEGVSLYTNIVNCDSGQLAVGDPVMLTFELAADGQKIPVFQPLR